MARTEGHFAGRAAFNVRAFDVFGSEPAAAKPNAAKSAEISVTRVSEISHITVKNPLWQGIHMRRIVENLKLGDRAMRYTISCRGCIITAFPSVSSASG
jgi:hypothetical protein